MKQATKRRRLGRGKSKSREDGPDRIEAHVAGICLRECRKKTWKILAAKRSQNRDLFPGKWECGGGKVRPGEGFENALRREMLEEFGVRVDPWFVMGVYEIHVRSPQRVIPGVRFVCLWQAGIVKLDKREFSAYKWLDLPLRESLDWIGGLEEAIKYLVTPRLLSERRPLKVLRT